MRSIRFVFTFMEGLTLGIALLFVLLLSVLLQNEIKSRYVDMQVSQIDQVDLFVDRFIEDNRAMFAGFSAMSDKGSAVRLMRDFPDIYVCTADCVIIRIIKKDPGSYIFPGYDLGRSAVCRYLKQNRQGAFDRSPLVRSPETDRPSMYLVTSSGGELLVGRIGLDTFKDNLGRIAHYTNSIIVLASRDGYILSSTREPLPVYSLYASAVEEVSLFGSSYLYTRKRSQILDNDIAIFTPLSTVYVILRWVRWFFVAFIALIVVVIMTKIALQSYLIIRPLGAFSEMVRAWDPASAPPDAPRRFLRYEEIATLHASFSERSDRVRAAMAALRESEEKFRTMVSSMVDLIFFFDDDGRIVFYHAPSAVDLFMPPEMFMHKKVAEVLPPDVREKWDAAFEMNRSGAPAEFDYSLPMPEGVRWFSIKMSPNLVGSVFHGSIAVIRDISDRKRAEERALNDLKEKEILLREIHHRVKNNLTVISSLLNLQAGAVKSAEDAQDAFRESRNRIMSMALVHEKLYGDRDLSRVNFGEYVESMAHEIIRSYALGTPVELALNVEKLDLEITKAIPCGLILNELVSNAIKYAFAGRASGRIKCSLRATDGGMLELAVRDDGVGLPDGFNPETVTSLGMRLVTMLTGQLGGSLAVERNDGAGFVVTFPA